MNYWLMKKLLGIVVLEMYSTLYSTCFKKMAYYESPMIQKWRKHWRNN